MTKYYKYFHFISLPHFQNLLRFLIFFHKSSMHSSNIEYICRPFNIMSTANSYEYKISCSYMFHSIQKTTYCPHFQQICLNPPRFQQIYLLIQSQLSDRNSFSIPFSTAIFINVHPHICFPPRIFSFFHHNNLKIILP